MSKEEKWPEYPYKAMRSNPYSIMSREPRGLFFVTCAETRAEVEETMRSLTKTTDEMSAPYFSRRIYFNGSPA